MGMLEHSELAVSVFTNLLADCNQDGVWSPKGLRSAPKSQSGLTGFVFPLELDTKTTERRRSDVTFRLALIARFAGLELSYV